MNGPLVSHGQSISQSVCYFVSQSVLSDSQLLRLKKSNVLIVVLGAMLVEGKPRKGSSEVPNGPMTDGPMPDRPMPNVDDGMVSCTFGCVYRPIECGVIGAWWLCVGWMWFRGVGIGVDVQGGVYMGAGIGCVHVFCC